MKRRIVLATCLAGIVAGSAGAAVAAPDSPVKTAKQDVCVGIAQNDNYSSADYYCIDVGGLAS
jgi:uncharacterized membrane protein